MLFSEWLTSHGLDAKEQHAYMKRGWLTRLSKGVYALQGTNPTLLHAVSAYNTQLSKKCIIGAYTALELRGYSHYLCRPALSQLLCGHHQGMMFSYT